MFNSFHSTFGLKFHSSQNINYFGIKCTYDIFVLAVLINYIFISAVVKMLALSNVSFDSSKSDLLSSSCLTALGKIWTASPIVLQEVLYPHLFVCLTYMNVWCLWLLVAGWVDVFSTLHYSEKLIIREQSGWLVQKDMSHQQGLSANWEGCDRGTIDSSDMILHFTCVVTNKFSSDC